MATAFIYHVEKIIPVFFLSTRSLFGFTASQGLLELVLPRREGSSWLGGIAEVVGK